MIRTVGQPRVIFSRDGSQSLYLLSAFHNSADRTVRLLCRNSIDGAAVPVIFQIEDGVDPQSLASHLRLPASDSPITLLAIWQYWEDLDLEFRDGNAFEATELTLVLGGHALIRSFRSNRPKVAPLDAVQHAAATSARFGISGLVDELTASIARCTFEELRRVVMEGRDTLWTVEEHQTERRLSIEPLGGFRAAHGLLQATSILEALSAPRYAGVANYWRKSRECRFATPPDVSGAVANASHSAEALARVVLGDDTVVLGKAVELLAARGKITEFTKRFGTFVHGNTSGDIGARHGAPGGPGSDTRDADLYMAALSALIGQLLLADSHSK